MEKKIERLKELHKYYALKMRTAEDYTMKAYFDGQVEGILMALRLLEEDN
ncbi:hypothetical protein [Bacillus albus]|nr:hypothetical protein [Bacillus albus]